MISATIWEIRVKQLMVEGLGLESILSELAKEYKMSEEEKEQIRVMVSAGTGARNSNPGG